MPDEPTVLDFVKSLLTPWRGRPLQIPPAERELEEIHQEGEATPLAESVSPSSLEAPVPQQLATVEPISQPLTPHRTKAVALPWIAFIALGLALVAQFSLEPRMNRSWMLGAFLYVMAAAWAIYAYWKNQWVVPLSPEEGEGEDNYKVRVSVFLVALPLVILAFLTLGGNQFTTLNVTLWILAILAVLWAFWQGTPQLSTWWDDIRSLLRFPWKITISRDTLVMIIFLVLILFFRVYQMDTVPPEMVSDQAEKLLDVGDVLDGQTRIFFPRNTGREGLQMYMTAAVALLFGTGLSFTSLKIGTILLGLFTLPYIYLLGKELGSARAGLFAMVLVGIAYWPNVITRVGLRFSLYSALTAPTLYFLIRGLRTRNRNYFLISGIFLGIGLHGYTPFRVVPILVVVAVILYMLHRQSQGARRQAIWWLAALVVVAVVVFLPLLRFWIESPELFFYRTMTRIGSIESPLPAPGWQIFLKNLWDAMVMFFWDNGEVWVVSVTHRPALDIVTAVLFFIGATLLFVRYLRERNWVDLFLLISIPLLMLPSILSLAFPSENPILNRTAGAIVPVFLIAGIALDGLLTGITKREASSTGVIIAWVTGILLLSFSMLHNYDLVFNQYQEAYTQSSWNTSEMGAVIRNYGELHGGTETTWVVAYPHWVDTRLVGINAGEPHRDFAIWPEAFGDTLTMPNPKLFLIKPEDLEAVDALHDLYPAGSLSVYESTVDKDFLLFYVPDLDSETESPAVLPPSEDTTGQPYP
jgi:4-amino-4-deoxy-L-arabinose transferase-like glycosyltransferase